MTRSSSLIFCLLFLVGFARADDVLSLTVAARRGDLEAVRALLSSGVKPSAPDINGSTALHAAAGGGQLVVMEFLMSAGADPDVADHQGRRPLYEAASSGSLECCRLLIERGAGLDAPTVGGWTPLTAALHWGSDEVTNYLLGLGAEWNLGDDIPLIEASRRGYRLTVKRLLKDGARVSERDESGRTALHFAASTGQTEVVDMLLGAGANPETPDNLGNTPFQIAAENSQLGNIERMLPRVERPGSALPQACAAGSVETVSRLLAISAGDADVSADCLEVAAGREDHAVACQVLALLLPGKHPLDSALRAATSVGNIEAVRLLLQEGARPTREATLMAAELVRIEILELFLEAGADRPQITEVESRWAGRRRLLQSTIDQYSGMRCLHPAESEARRELTRLEESTDQVSRLLREAQ